MSMRAAKRCLALGGLVFFVGPAIACGVSADPRYFALSSYPGERQPGAPHMIKLRRPGLAGYLDRSDIVNGVGDHRVRIANGERWGEPLGDMIGRVLAEDLTLRLPQTNVFTEAGAISADADAVVEVDVRRFDADANGTVRLLAQVVIERGLSHAAAGSESFTLEGRPRQEGTSELVATMSELLGQLADKIACLARVAHPQ